MARHPYNTMILLFSSFATNGLALAAAPAFVLFSALAAQERHP
jgi:hypothetical protein